MGCPFDVVEYSIDVVCMHIAHITHTPFHHVRQKPQIQYLDNYLLSQNEPAKTVVIEYEYIERSFLEDYAAYYSRCFHKYPKTCSRLHFFSALNECCANETRAQFNNHDLERILLNPAKTTLSDQDLEKNILDLL